MSTTYCTDTDLLCWEPNLFIDAMFTSQTLLEGTGDLAGATFTIDAGSLEASHVAAGQVIVLAGGTTGTYPIVGVATDTQLVVSVLYDGLFPVGASPDPSPIGAATDLSFAIRTFSPQAKVVSDWMMRSIGIDADSGIAILNESALRRPCAAGTLAMIFSAIAVGEDRADRQAKAELYERLFQQSIRGTVLELDTNGDGQAEERRALNVVQLQRA